jgi:hypothetical protein
MMTSGDEQGKLAPLDIIDGRSREQLEADGDNRWRDGSIYTPPCSECSRLSATLATTGAELERMRGERDRWQEEAVRIGLKLVEVSSERDAYYADRNAFWSGLQETKARVADLERASPYVRENIPPEPA